MRFALVTDGELLDLSGEVVFLGRDDSPKSQLVSANLVGPHSYEALGQVAAGARLYVEIEADPKEVDKDGGHRVHLSEAIAYKGRAVLRSAERHSQVGGGTTVSVGPGRTMISLELELLDAPANMAP